MAVSLTFMTTVLVRVDSNDVTPSVAFVVGIAFARETVAMALVVILVTFTSMGILVLLRAVTIVAALWVVEYAVGVAVVAFVLVGLATTSVVLVVVVVDVVVVVVVVAVIVLVVDAALVRFVVLASKDAHTLKPSPNMLPSLAHTSSAPRAILTPSGPDSPSNAVSPTLIKSYPASTAYRDVQRTKGRNAFTRQLSSAPYGPSPSDTQRPPSTISQNSAPDTTSQKLMSVTMVVPDVAPVVISGSNVVSISPELVVVPANALLTAVLE